MLPNGRASTRASAVVARIRVFRELRIEQSPQGFAVTQLRAVPKLADRRAPGLECRGPVTETALILMRNAESEAQWKMHALRAAPSPSNRGPGLSPPGLLFVSRADRGIGSNHRVGSPEQRHTAHRQCPGRAEGFASPSRKMLRHRR